MRIGVIGSGMAGLVAGYRLAERGHEVTLFERSPEIGLDAHAAVIQVDGQSLRADVPSRMFNAGLWPRLTELYHELGVKTVPVDTSQSLSDADARCYLRLPDAMTPPDPETAWFRLDSRGMLDDARRLRKHGLRQRLSLWRSKHTTLQQWLDRRKFSREFVEGLLFPTLASTVCTCSFRSLANYPSHVILQTLGDMARGPGLRRSRFGTCDVADRLTTKFHEINLGRKVTWLGQDEQMAKVSCNRLGHGFDHVIVATQANTAMELVGHLSDAECRALGSFEYETIPVVIHRDRSLMPVDRESWSTFNMMPAPDSQTSMCTVWLNRFHHDWPEVQSVFQTINAFAEIEADQILASSQLQRPVVNQKSLRGREMIRQLHQDPARRIWFCGSYAGSGTPLLESAVESAISVTQAIEAQQARLQFAPTR